MHAVVVVASFPGHPNFIFQSGILSSEKLNGEGLGMRLVVWYYLASFFQSMCEEV